MATVVCLALYFAQTMLMFLVRRKGNSRPSKRDQRNTNKKKKNNNKENHKTSGWNLEANLVLLCQRHHLKVVVILPEPDRSRHGFN